jgi:hypothetical protein
MAWREHHSGGFGFKQHVELENPEKYEKYRNLQLNLY